MPPTNLPDAASKNWVDAYAPKALRPWLRLGRFDRPIGIWLLFLPCLMGLLLATNLSHSLPTLYFISLFALGACLMRAAGCAYNDVIDADIDKLVARTRERPIPSGQISAKAALLFAIICALISLIILLQLGTVAIYLGLGSVLLVCAYPFMKRLTWWPQVWLGLTFNWGLLMGYASIEHNLSLVSLVFYLGLVFWTIGYDTIYALQDIEDDALIGVKSSARALDKNIKLGVGFCYLMAFGLSGLAAALASLSALFYAVWLFVGFDFIRQLNRLKRDNGDLALAIFKSNRQTGLLWVLALLAGNIRF